MLHRCLALAALSVLLGACGQPTNGDSSSVTVSNAYNEYDALPKATEYCAQFGRVPRYQFLENYRATFRCMKES